MPSQNSYRFQVGTDVQCRTGPQEWSGGKIIALDYRDQSWPMGKTVPYQVELLDGRWVCVPKDLPIFCKKFVIPSWEKAVFEEDLQMLKDSVLKSCEQTDHHGRTPLLSCVERGWQDGAMFLLTHRADPFKTAGPEKNTPLHLAVLPLAFVRFQDTTANEITFCREDGVISVKVQKVESSGETVAECKEVSSIVYDCSDGKLTWANDSEEDSSSSDLFAAFRAWVPARIATLIRDTEVEAEGLPAASEDMSLVQALLKARADVNAQNEDPENDLQNFKSAKYDGLEQQQHRSALHFAAEAGDVGLCEALIQARAQINIEDRFKMTPLDLALEEGSQLTLELLLKSDADPNRGNMLRGLKQTVLHHVSAVGNVEIVKLLLRYKYDVNMPGKQDMTPLHLAARKKDVELVKVLLEAHADVGLSDIFGHTPGEYAILNESSKLGKALALEDNLHLSDRMAFL